MTIFGTEGTYEGPPVPPSNFVSTATSLTQIDHTWDSVSGASDYLLIMNEGSPVTFIPANGTAYSEGSQVGGDIVHFGSDNFDTQTSAIVANSRYYYALYAYDGSDYSIVASTSVVSTLDCSDTTYGDWIRVPGNVAYEGRDFCVMKYEAKNVSSTPESNASGNPWVSISQTTAAAECASIGAQLISNDQWMTIATNIANQGNNWQGGTVGTNSLNRGNSNGSVQEVSDDSNACDGTSAPSCTPTSSWHINRRTHTLSNGEVIWDMAGNVWEWTSYVISYNNNKPSGSEGDDWTEYNTVNGTASMAKSELISNSWISSQGAGQYYRGPQDSGGALRRGGNWGSGTRAGVFAAYLSSDSSNSYTNTVAFASEP